MIEPLLTKSSAHFIYYMNVTHEDLQTQSWWFSFISLFWLLELLKAKKMIMSIVNVKDCEGSNIYTTIFYHFPSQVAFPFFFFNVRHRWFRSYDHEAASLKNLTRTHHWWHVLSPFAWQHLGWSDCQICRHILADTYKSRLPAVQRILRVHNVTVNGC